MVYRFQACPADLASTLGGGRGRAACVRPETMILSTPISAEETPIQKNTCSAEVHTIRGYARTAKNGPMFLWLSSSTLVKYGMLLATIPPQIPASMKHTKVRRRKYFIPIARCLKPSRPSSATSNVDKVMYAPMWNIV